MNSAAIPIPERMGPRQSPAEMPVPLTGNRPLDEIDQAHASLSPEAKKVLETVRQQSQPQLPASPGAIPMGAPAAPSAPGSIQISPDAKLSANPGAIALPETPAAPAQHPAHIPVPANPALAPAQERLAHIQSTGPGVSQIKHAGLRIPLQILDAIGSGILPGVAMGIPGTSAHHALVRNEAEGAVKSQEAQQNEAVKRAQEEATTAETEGRTAGQPTEEALHAAQAHHAEAQAGAITHPKAEGKTIETSDGIMQFNPESGKYDIPVGEAPGKNATQHVVTPDGSVIAIHTNAKTGETSHEVVYHGDPKKQTELADLQINGRPHKVIVDKMTGETIKDLGESGIKPPVVNVHNDERKDRAAGLKAYTPAMDSAERFNVMTKNYEDAIKNHDQQAMLSLLANHLGMTMGLQKGSRLTKDIIHEAEQSRPWLQGLKAKFSKEGYLTGVNLTPGQMDQMVNLGRERFSEDVTKGRNEAEYQGISEGPKRTPNEATITHYVRLAGGDPEKAKKLAKTDGWSIE